MTRILGFPAPASGDPAGGNEQLVEGRIGPAHQGTGTRSGRRSSAARRRGRTWTAGAGRRLQEGGGDGRGGGRIWIEAWRTRWMDDTKKGGRRVGRVCGGLGRAGCTIGSVPSFERLFALISYKRSLKYKNKHGCNINNILLKHEKNNFCNIKNTYLNVSQHLDRKSEIPAAIS